MTLNCNDVTRHETGEDNKLRTVQYEKMEA